MADPIWEGTVSEAITEVKNEVKKLEIEINKTRARQRYLSHMAKAQAEEDDDDEGICILCRCEFTKGYITHWWVSVSFRRCQYGLKIDSPVLTFIAR